MIAALRCKPSATDVGGPETAPHTPQRSERPGKPVALLDHAPSARSAPGNPWRSSITRPALGAPRETRGAPRRSGRKVAEHAARSEERRVGKECRCRWSHDRTNKTSM